MTRRRIGIVAAVVAAVALVTVIVVSGAYRRACPDSLCATAEGDRTATSPDSGRVSQPPGNATSTPSPPPPGTPSAQPVPTARRADRLEPGQALLRGQTLTSPDGRYTLALQDTDGNLVIYEEGRTAIWQVGPSVDAASLVNQLDGNVVLVRKDGRPIWSSGTAGKTGSTLYLFDDGNLVLLDRAERTLWESDTGSNR